MIKNDLLYFYNLNLNFVYFLNLFFFVVVSKFMSTPTVNHPTRVKTNAATDTSNTSVGALYPHGIVPLLQGNCIRLWIYKGVIFAGGTCPDHAV